MLVSEAKAFGLSGAKAIDRSAKSATEFVWNMLTTFAAETLVPDVIEDVVASSSDVSRLVRTSTGEAAHTKPSASIRRWSRSASYR
jgi:hypothetical protein